MDEDLRSRLNDIERRLTKIENYLTSVPKFLRSIPVEDVDPLFEDAVRVVCQYDKASSSMLQRRLQIGFNKAARLIEQLEKAGVVSPANGPGPREVLVKNTDDFLLRSNELKAG